MLELLPSAEAPEDLIRVSAYSPGGAVLLGLSLVVGLLEDQLRWSQDQ